MGRFGNISEKVTGNLKFLGSCTFAGGLGESNTPGNIRYVDGLYGNDANDGSSWETPWATVQKAATAIGERGVIFVAPGEYDEDVILSTSKVKIIGVGSNHSVRITGTSAGTATALTLSGVSDVGIYNLNLEGRSGGAGLSFTGQIRRVDIEGCKLHGGTNALQILVPASSQTVDITIRDNLIANATNGININYSGGDPCHQIKILGNLFSKIVTDNIVENGVTHDYIISGNVFGMNNTSESTQFLDIDETGTNGFVTDNLFATTVFSTAKFAIATGVLFANNISEQENLSANVGGTNGRPD